MLYVEDDPSSFYFIKNIFYNKIDKNVKLILANNGEEAIKTLRREEIHLILVDYFLPDTNGLELIEKIKAEREEIPIVMITGFGDEKIATEAMKKGAVDYLTKWGNNINELSKCLQAYIDLAKQLNTSFYTKYEEIRKRRDAMNIICCLLKHAVNGIKKTRLLYKTNLNSKTLEKYLMYCIKQGYIQIRGVERLYITTRKGMELLRKMEEINELLA